MLNFHEWLNEGVKIIHIDPEEDWMYANTAHEIADMVNIRPGRDKEPTIVAINDQDEVVGAAFTSWHDDDEETQMQGRPIAQWTFDVVVHPKWQGHKLIGIQLIQQAEQERKNLEGMYGQDAYTRLWVVNPKLAQLLQKPKFGYEPESEYSDGSAHLRKY